MIVWPDALVREIARRRCVLFLGAGVSAAARTIDGESPPMWAEFLEKAKDLLRDDRMRADAVALIESRRLLLALQVIKDNAPIAGYRALLDSCFNDQRFTPQDLHRVILALDSRVVITTNFDKIYERLCLGTSNVGYKTIPYYSGDLADELRSDTRLIVKAHGTIDEISRMVFTKSEYHRAKSEHAKFYETLRAIFLTHTGIFIGCSLDDPDVLLMLEDVKITASGEKPHYALMLDERQSVHEKVDLLKSYNVSVIEYGPNHDVLVAELAALGVAVQAMRNTYPES